MTTEPQEEGLTIAWIPTEEVLEGHTIESGQITCQNPADISLVNNTSAGHSPTLSFEGD